MLPGLGTTPSVSPFSQEATTHSYWGLCLRWLGVAVASSQGMGLEGQQVGGGDEGGPEEGSQTGWVALGCVGDSAPRQPAADGVRWQLHSCCHDNSSRNAGRPVRRVCLCSAELREEPRP